MKVSRYNLLVGATIGALLLIVNMYVLNHPLIGIAAMTWYLYFLIRHVHSLIGNNSSTFIWSILTVLFGVSILITASYYLYSLTPHITTIITLLPLLLFGFSSKPKQFSQTVFSKEQNNTYLLLGAFLLLECSLFFTLLINRTTEVSNSPWLHIPFWFFILYGLATIITILITLRAQNKLIKYTATSLHLFLTYTITIIIYPLGFGFDGFIHRATETWIQTHGSISPLQPVYIGQYSLVVWLSNLTAVPIFIIDSVFVPLLSAITLPAVVGTTLHNVWKIKESHSINLVWILPVLYYLSLHLTTPHNVLLLVSIYIVFGVTAYLHNKLHILPLLILATAGLGIHALLGAPAFLFVLAAWILQNIQKYKTTLLTLYTVGISLLFPVLFSLYFILTKHPLPSITNPVNHVYAFLALFKRPFWYETTSTFILELLYDWQRLLPILLSIAALVAFIYISRKHKLSSVHLLFISTFIGFWIGAFLLRSWITFPDVGALEQGDYPLRLIKSSIIYLLPFLMYVCYIVGTQIRTYIHKLPLYTKQTVHVSSFVIIATLITTSLYLAYPQENAKAHFPGYNVTLSDFKAAHWIQQDNEEYNYIVLSNPLTAIAAMTEFGFPKYFKTKDGGLHSYYSIPTGAELYKYYANMLYSGQDRTYMNEAMAYTGATKSYFVVSSFWSRFNDIVAGAKETADSVHVIDNGKIYIFTYYLRNENFLTK